MREPRTNLMMNIARLVADRSTCRRVSVGCVVTNSEMTQVFSYGYNGNYRGGPNDCDREGSGSCRCVHAEVNALIKAPYSPGADLRLFTTMSPCVACAKVILNSGIAHVFYAELYRDLEGLRLLEPNLKLTEIRS